jgi:hypothetical protein
VRTLALGVVLDLDNLAVRVNGGSLSFVVLNGALLVAEDSANGLHDGAVLNQTRGARRQQGSEEEVVARRDDDDIVVLGVEVLEETDGAPTRS